MAHDLSIREDGSAEFFSVREVPWHHLGDVYEQYPTSAADACDKALGKRDDSGLIIPGSAWDVTTTPDVQFIGTEVMSNAPAYSPGPGIVGDYQPNPEHNRHIRSDNGFVLHVAPASFTAIPNRAIFELGWAIGEVDGTAKFETGGALDNGRDVFCLIRLDDPIQIDGDQSVTLPYACVKAAHNGDSALRAEFTNVRVVCRNTARMSEMISNQYQSAFTIRHTKNWEARIEDAKAIIKNLRKDLEAYRVMMNALASITVTDAEWDQLVEALFPKAELNQSTRTKNNVSRDRAKFNAVRRGRTLEGIGGNAYGMLMASTEFLDWERNAKGGADSYLKRTMIERNGAKAKVMDTVCRVAGIADGAKGLAAAVRD